MQPGYVCTDCEDGHVLLDGDCKACKTGSNCLKCEENVEKCSACPDGYVRVGDVCQKCTAGQCQSCPDGQFLKAGDCKVCKDNCELCADGTGACKKCATGYRVHASGVCETCKDEGCAK